MHGCFRITALGRRVRPQTKGKAVGYALLANIISFAGGLWLAHFIPGIF